MHKIDSISTKYDVGILLHYQGNWSAKDNGNKF